jgi:hypothetical protein
MTLHVDLHVDSGFSTANNGGVEAMDLSGSGLTTVSIRANNQNAGANFTGLESLRFRASLFLRFLFWRCLAIHFFLKDHLGTNVHRRFILSQSFFGNIVAIANLPIEF